MQIEDSTVWSAAIAVIGTIVTSVRLVFNRIRHLEMHTVSKAEFENLEREVVKKDDFKEYAERSEQTRAEVRESISKLFDKFDELKTVILRGRI